MQESEFRFKKKEQLNYIMVQLMQLFLWLKTTVLAVYTEVFYQLGEDNASAKFSISLLTNQSWEHQLEKINL